MHRHCSTTARRCVASCEQFVADLDSDRRRRDANAGSPRSAMADVAAQAAVPHPDSRDPPLGADCAGGAHGRLRTAGRSRSVLQLGTEIAEHLFARLFDDETCSPCAPRVLAGPGRTGAAGGARLRTDRRPLRRERRACPPDHRPRHDSPRALQRRRRPARRGGPDDGVDASRSACTSQPPGEPRRSGPPMSASSPSPRRPPRRRSGRRRGRCSLAGARGVIFDDWSSLQQNAAAFAEASAFAEAITRNMALYAPLRHVEPTGARAFVLKGGQDSVEAHWLESADALLLDRRQPRRRVPQRHVHVSARSARSGLAEHAERRIGQLRCRPDGALLRTHRPRARRAGADDPQAVEVRAGCGYRLATGEPIESRVFRESSDVAVRFHSRLADPQVLRSPVTATAAAATIPRWSLSWSASPTSAKRGRGSRRSRASRRSSTSRRRRAGRSSSSARTCSRAARSRFAAPTTWSRGSPTSSGARGVITYSSGNHGQAVALAARAARRAGGGRHADDRAGDQGRRRPRVRRRSDLRRHDVGRAPRARRGRSRGARPDDGAAVRSRMDHRRPGHASGSRSSSSAPTSRRSSCRSAAAVWLAGVAAAIKQPRPARQGDRRRAVRRRHDDAPRSMPGIPSPCRRRRASPTASCRCGPAI